MSNVRVRVTTMLTTPLGHWWCLSGLCVRPAASQADGRYWLAVIALYCVTSSTRGSNNADQALGGRPLYRQCSRACGAIHASGISPMQKLQALPLRYLFNFAQLIRFLTTSIGVVADRDILQVGRGPLLSRSSSGTVFRGSQVYPRYTQNLEVKIIEN